jgi:S1-C subfamily serine protease
MAEPHPPAVSGTTASREVHVTRGDIQALLTGAGGTDMTPVEENGKQIGMKLVGADSGTTAAKLGAATGDIIYSIAGHPLDSIPAAYRAGDLAARESRIEIRASRNGAPYTLLLVVDP